MVGFHPDDDLIAEPPYAGFVQATTGKATATSPFTGTVVAVVPPAVVDVPATVDDEEVSRSDEPHPVSTTSPAAATPPARRKARRGRSPLATRCMTLDDRPVDPCGQWVFGSLVDGTTLR